MNNSELVHEADCMPDAPVLMRKLADRLFEIDTLVHDLYKVRNNYNELLNMLEDYMYGSRA